MTDAELLAVAVQAAQAGAAELLPRFGRRDGVRTKSSPTDLVSDADVAAERAIRAVLAEHRPGDPILGEEGGSSDGSDEDSAAGSVESAGAPAEEGSPESAGGSAEERRLRWVVDPLDGTVNFLFGIPVFAVSVACEDKSGMRAGVVLDPIREECFAATRSGPATINGEEIELFERTSELGLAMVATGFAYDSATRARQAVVVSRVLPRARDIRRAGAAALDLAWCGCGRYDAYYERGLHTWDLAAGGLIAERTGLAVRKLPATGEDREGVVVASPELMEELYSLVRG